MTTLLRSTRLALRPVERMDLSAFAGWFSRYELQRTLNPGAIRLPSLDDEDAWYDTMRKDSALWTFAIDALDDPHAPDGRLIGSTSLLNVNGKNRSATFGLAIADPAMRGRGYGSEAVDLMLEWGFLELNLNRIQLFVFSFNQPAIKLYEQKGFQHEGCLRDAVFREGRYEDELIMSMLRREWTQPRDFGSKETV